MSIIPTPAPFCDDDWHYTIPRPPGACPACAATPVTAPRSTSTPTVAPRTAAATAARRRAYAAKIAHEVACRLDELDNERVAVLAGALVAEALRRGLAVPDLRV